MAASAPATPYPQQADGTPVLSPTELRILRRVEQRSQKDLSGAIAELQGSLRPTSSAALDYAMGRLQLRAKQESLGILHLQAATLKAPRYYMAWNTLGLACLQAGRFDDALVASSSMLALRPGSPDPQALAASARSGKGDHVAAEKHYREALRVAPGRDDLVLGLTRCLFEQRRFTEAAANLEPSLVAQPKRSELWLLQANCLLAGKDARGAGRSLQALIELESQPQGCAHACFALGWALRLRDGEQAAHWMRWAATSGLSAAQAEYGQMLLEGRGVESNRFQGAHWLELAAEQGLASAQTNLALLYIRGSGVVRDIDKARSWYERAAQQNSSEAFHRLGMLHSRGLGMPVDWAQAAAWWRLAAEAEHPGAKQLLHAIEEDMSPAQLASARERVLRWRKLHPQAPAQR